MDEKVQTNGEYHNYEFAIHFDLCRSHAERHPPPTHTQSIFYQQDIHVDYPKYTYVDVDKRYMSFFQVVCEKKN